MGGLTTFDNWPVNDWYISGRDFTVLGRLTAVAFSRNGGRRRDPAALTLLQAFNDFIKTSREFSHITEIIQYIQRLAHQGQGTIVLLARIRSIVPCP